jgi:hypothetical protein
MPPPERGGAFVRDARRVRRTRTASFAYPPAGAHTSAPDATGPPERAVRSYEMSVSLI